MFVCLCVCVRMWVCGVVVWWCVCVCVCVGVCGCEGGMQCCQIECMKNL